MGIISVDEAANGSTLTDNLNNCIEKEKAIIEGLEGRMNQINLINPSLLSSLSPSEYPDELFLYEGIRRERKKHIKQLKRYEIELSQRKQYSEFGKIDLNHALKVYPEITEDILVKMGSDEKFIDKFFSNLTNLMIFLSNKKNLERIFSISFLGLNLRKVIVSSETYCQIALGFGNFIDMLFNDKTVLREFLESRIFRRWLELSPCVYSYLKWNEIPGVKEETCSSENYQILLSDNYSEKWIFGINGKNSGIKLTNPILVIAAYYEADKISDAYPLVSTYGNHILNEGDHLKYPNGETLTNRDSYMNFNLKKLSNGSDGYQNMIPIMKICDVATFEKGVSVIYIEL